MLCSFPKSGDRLLYAHETNLINHPISPSSILHTSWLLFPRLIFFSLLILILVIYQLIVSIVSKMLVTKDDSHPLLVLHFLLPVATGIYYAIGPLIPPQTRSRHYDSYSKRFVKAVTVWIRIIVLVTFV